MMKINQAQIAKKSGLHVSTVSNIFNGLRRPSWRNAKRLAEATGTDPVIWLEGSANEIKNAILEAVAVSAVTEKTLKLVKKMDKTS